MYELALFAGIGGGILGGKILGWRTVCAVEKEAHPIGVLMQRQNDRALHPFPVWDDIRTFSDTNPDTEPMFEHLRRIRRTLVISGGFPCQDISVAGKGAGLDGENSGLWRHMRRVVCEVRPAVVFVENSPMLTGRGLHIVLGELSTLGYHALWGVLGADDVGANHQRERIWILAYTDEIRPHQSSKIDQAKQSGKNGLQRRIAKIPDTNCKQCEKFREPKPKRQAISRVRCSAWWQTEPALGRVVDGYAGRVDELKGIGNAQVPQVAAAIYKILDYIKTR